MVTLTAPGVFACTVVPAPVQANVLVTGACGSAGSERSTWARTVGSAAVGLSAGSSRGCSVAGRGGYGYAAGSTGTPTARPNSAVGAPSVKVRTRVAGLPAARWSSLPALGRVTNPAHCSP